MYDTSNELCFLMPCVFLLVYALLSHLSSDHEFSMANLGMRRYSSQAPEGETQTVTPIIYDSA